MVPGEEVGSSIRNPCRKVAGLDRCVDEECNARLPSTCIRSSLEVATVLYFTKVAIACCLASITSSLLSFQPSLAFVI